ncbi:MAG: hypothetical protein ACUVRL_09380 [Candidatus Saccharicenans sp.]|uniref:hypothetical protein n=1 Tax=Candidatus Saccharicenans sp. TaxID=2819258 RepID=UPI004048EE89
MIDRKHPSVFLFGLAILLIAGFKLPRTFLSPVLAFPPEEYARRRARLMDHQIDGMAIFPGSRDPSGDYRFNQNNDLIYLGGVEIGRYSGDCWSKERKYPFLYHQWKRGRWLRSSAVFKPRATKGNRYRESFAGRSISPQPVRS